MNSLLATAADDKLFLTLFLIYYTFLDFCEKYGLKFLANRLLADGSHGISSLICLIKAGKFLKMLSAAIF